MMKPLKQLTVKLLDLFDTIFWTPVNEFMEWTDDNRDDWRSFTLTTVVMIPSIVFMFFFGLVLLALRKLRSGDTGE